MNIKMIKYSTPILMTLALSIVFGGGYYWWQKQHYYIPKIDYTTHVLDNGLTVLIHKDSKAPIASTYMLYKAGSIHEQDNQTGIAHLLEHMTFSRSENLDMDFVQYLRPYGTTSHNAMTTLDETHYFVVTPKNMLDSALWLQSERMGNFAPAMTDEALRNEISIVKNEKRSGEGQPYGKLFNFIKNVVYPKGHPYTRTVIGTYDDLDAMTVDKVAKWWQQYYAPNNALLVIAGDVNIDDVKNKVEKYFGHLQSTPMADPKIPAHVDNNSAKTHTYYEHTSNPALVKVYRFDSNADNAHLYAMLSSVLSDNSEGFLSKDIVENRKLATQIYTSVEKSVYGGEFYLFADTAPNVDVAELSSAIDESLGKFLSSNTIDVALENVKNRQINKLYSTMERIGGYRGKSAILAAGWLRYDNPEHYQSAMQKSLSVTVDDIVDTAKTLQGKMTTIYIMPKTADKDGGGKNPLVDGDTAQPLAPEYHPVKPTQLRALVANPNPIPPLPTTAKQLNFAPAQKIDLGGNTTLYYIHRPHTSMLSAQLIFEGGYITNPTHADTRSVGKITNQAWGDATTTQDSEMINRFTSKMGLSMAASMGRGRTVFSLKAPNHNAGETIPYFIDTIVNAKFSDEDIQRKKTIYKKSEQQSRTNPADIPWYSISKILYGDNHALAKISDLEGIDSITKADIETFYQNILNTPRTVVLVGDVPVSDIKKYLAGLQTLTPKNTAQPLAHRMGVKAHNNTIHYIPVENTQQVQINAIYPAPPSWLDNPYRADTLAQTFKEKLNDIIRLQNGWTYGVYGWFYKPHLGLSRLGIETSVQTDKLVPAVREIQNQYKALRTCQALSDKDILAYKQRLLWQMPSELEVSSKYIGRFVENMSRTGKDNATTAIQDNIDALQSIDVKNSCALSKDLPRDGYMVVTGSEKYIADLKNAGYTVKIHTLNNE